MASNTPSVRDFNCELIAGLWKIRNRYDVRSWLRQCIALERQRRPICRHLAIATNPKTGEAWCLECNKSFGKVLTPKAAA